MYVAAVALILGTAAAPVAQSVPAQPAARPADPPAELVVRAVRFYRADQQQTRVSAFIDIPYALLEPSASGAAGQLTYEATVTVKDTTGLELLRQRWQGHAPAAARVPGASGLEIFEFAVAPGRYRFEVTLRDSVSGRQTTAATDIQGYPATPATSDLLLAPRMRVAQAGDTVPQPGEIRRGNTLLAPAAELRLTPLRTEAFYLMEAYVDSASSGTLAVAVVDSTGKSLFETKPLSVAVPAGGGVLQGKVDLAGLPTGEYRFKVAVDLAGRKLEREATLSMAPLEQTLAREAERREAARETDAGYFAEMNERQLDDAFEPLSYIARSGELNVYKSGLSLAAKRNFLAQFWQKRDPSPGSDRNEARERFYDAIGYANKNFTGSGRTVVPGWRTDRGRIYIKFGLYDDVYRAQAKGTAPPHEVWRYSRGRDRYFIFADRTQLNEYKLIKTNELSETSLPGWEEILGAPQVEDVGRFLGVNFFVTQTTPR